MSGNLLYQLGGSPTDVVTMGHEAHAAWVPEVDAHFERYRVEVATTADSWADFEQFEATLADSLGVGPLILEPYPRGRARVISLANSGGTLVNTLTGTAVQSVFPESIETDDRFHWAGRVAVTFVKARRPAMTGSNLFFRVGESVANTIALGAFEESDWTPEVDGRYERYQCAVITNVASWAEYAAFETSLANSLALGPLEFVDYPRGRSRIISWTNSGGTLYNAATGEAVDGVYPESIRGEDHDNWTGRALVIFIRARKSALSGSNLFFRVGGSAANTIALGVFPESEWTPQVDGRFERYRCAIVTDVDTWADYETFEASLAGSLGLGDLKLATYPKDAGRILSWSNSGGTLYNALTGTTITSVFPESIDPEDHARWTGRATVTFVAARHDKLGGGNLFFRVGGNPANAVPLGVFEESDWTPDVGDRFVRYHCAVVADVRSWPSAELAEVTLAGSLGLGPLKLVAYPRGGGRIASFANSGGTLVNSLTGTTITSVFPESVKTARHDEWDGRLTVTFVKAR